MPFREGDETVDFEGVVVTDPRPIDKRSSSVICKFDDGTERPVPRSQVREDFLFPGDPGCDLGKNEPFDLEVARWIVDQWDKDGPPPVVKINGVEVLEEIDGQYGPALKCRFPGESKAVYVSLRALDKGSPINQAGDAGEIWVAKWWADKKGIGGGSASRQAPASNIGRDARSGKAPDPADDEDDPGF